jgi:periplasmic divalent cation tolerance protein
MFVAVYITCSGEKEAEKIGRILVEKKLVACVNIIPNIKSIYRWNNKIEKSNETLIFGKTRESLKNRIIKTVKENHSYEVPCITFLPVTGDIDYLKWVENETK